MEWQRAWREPVHTSSSVSPIRGIVPQASSWKASLYRCFTLLTPPLKPSRRPSSAHNCAERRGARTHRPRHFRRPGKIQIHRELENCVPTDHRSSAGPRGSGHYSGMHRDTTPGGAIGQASIAYVRHSPAACRSRSNDGTSGLSWTMRNAA